MSFEATCSLVYAYSHPTLRYDNVLETSILKEGVRVFYQILYITTLNADVLHSRDRRRKRPRVRQLPIPLHPAPLLATSSPLVLRLCHLRRRSQPDYRMAGRWQALLTHVGQDTSRTRLEVDAQL